jgi:ubiquitin carboxyl-terminal hydrolase 7
LQSLFHLTSLRSAVYAMPTEDLETDSMALALQRVFVQLQTIETAVSTKELTKTFR